MTFGDMLSMFHGVDERVSVASVGLTANFLAETVAAFGRQIET
jgi:di/tripeptidase